MSSKSRDEKLVRRIDEIEKQIERRIMRGNARLIGVKRRIEKLEEQLRRIPSAG